MRITAILLLGGVIAVVGWAALPAEAGGVVQRSLVAGSLGYAGILGWVRWVLLERETLRPLGWRGE